MNAGDLLWSFFLAAMMVVEGVGLFTPKWISTESCTSVGILYSCCSGPNNASCTTIGGLDSPALGLHCTAFALMFLTIFFKSCELYSIKKKETEDAAMWGKCAFCFYFLNPIAGIFSFAGCIMINHNHDHIDVGYSFLLCIFSSGITVFGSLFAGCVYYFSSCFTHL